MNKTLSLRQTGALIVMSFALAACGQKDTTAVDAPSAAASAPVATKEAAPAVAAPRPDVYASFPLTADVSHLSDQQREMLRLMIEASDIMDDLFWRQAFRDDWRQWLAGIDDPQEKRFAAINYGPWDRLADEQPFMEGFGAKPLGANLYPADITREEFDAWDQPGKDGLYTLVRRDENGKLQLVPYHVAYAEELARAAVLLQQAAELAEDEGFSNYLRLRADALVTGEFQASDMAWMDVKTNAVELVIGPIESYEDRLYGYRTAYESYVLLKDAEWSERLARFAAFLPDLQRGLPVADAYKAETPGTDSDLNAYDVVYYAGHSNAGSKTIAINLPNDEQVQLAKGTRRLQLKNAMQAKFEKILQPIAGILMDESQRQHITFDAFFANTMFHEVAHGLGIKNTIDGSRTVRAALKDVASSMEEGKADILGLYMISRLHAAGELGDIDLRDNYVTFMAGIFRSVRFGASSAHGKANMVRFNFFADHGAFVRDEVSGTYKVDFERMEEAMASLSDLLLTLQGDGDYDGANRLTNETGVIRPTLQRDLDRLTEANIPVDIIFDQGVQVLGLD
ncbi:dipeptidyl-peptidase 3 family protein [Woeseia oceani]|uniref:Zn-dependent hydrolase n=1 Tax=Woeseia oceani TaxID=1548547 RepID=A0A193LIK0_9GAMM|nr:Zn-dependent hydrolase [Woeseia oceani]ANO52273.1 Zn-dependent hydrolase [Woeseia oceani]